MIGRARDRVAPIARRDGRRPGARARLLHGHRARHRPRLGGRPARRRALPVPLRLDPHGHVERPLGGARAWDSPRSARSRSSTAASSAAVLDEEGSRVAGVRVGLMNTIVAVLAALTVGISMRIVGILLIAALMVLPVIAAQRVAWSLRSTLGLAMALRARVGPRRLGSLVLRRPAAGRDDRAARGRGIGRRTAGRPARPWEMMRPR